ncbi:MAG: substrate-binding domain-containing protein [Desulfobacterales bacterium]|nr:substrate-binding domain-containing protein [Desulfobacterales bacterium]MDX2513477.1 substrate-binding domain-containing protein [Desulfobacterales bacterium]
MRKVFAAGLMVFLMMGIFSGVSLGAEKVLMMATTTSTDNTGLLDYLAPAFTKATGIDLRWTAIGTGKALKMGQNCDVDVLLVHAPGAEKKFVDAGFGVNRRELMYNDFVIIGPASDPAGIKGLPISKAMMGIQKSKALFVSRGDNSGTNKKEILLWKNAGMTVPDKEPWYMQAGQGMLATIQIAEQRNGYAMTDRVTYIKYSHNSGGNPVLKVIVEGDAILLNQYSAIAINTGNCPNAKFDLAMAFSDWMAGSEAQRMIKDFRLLGQQLFTPNAK